MNWGYVKGNKEEGGKLLMELANKAGPLWARGMLVQELGKALSDEEGKEVRRLTQEYFVARKVDAEKAAERSGAKFDYGAIMGEEIKEILGTELRRSYERTLGQGGKDFEKLLKDLEVTPEQDAKLHNLVEDFIRAEMGKKTTMKKVALFTKIYEILTPEQRKVLGEKLAAQRREQEGMSPAEYGKPMDGKGMKK